jgi:hypothetical protein
MVSRAILVVLAGVLPPLSGCASPSGAVRPAAADVPIVFNPKDGAFDAAELLGRPGDEVCVHGALVNTRLFEERPPSQSLVVMRPGEPFSGYWLHLGEPALDLPASYPEFADPPGKNIVGPFKMTGRLATTKTESGVAYQLIVKDMKRLPIDRELRSLCVKVLCESWPRISAYDVSIPAEWRKRPIKLGQVAMPMPPTLMGVSPGGRECLFLCAEGRRYLAIHGETLARVYCLVDAKAGRVRAIYIKSTSYALE